MVYDWQLIPTANNPGDGGCQGFVYEAARSRLYFANNCCVNIAGTIYPCPAIWDGTDWSSISPPALQNDRQSYAICYDIANDRVIIFGGFDNNSGLELNDTWLFNGTTWNQPTPATSPPTYRDANMEYDRANGNVVLFGGVDLSGPAIYSARTWIWDGATYTEVFPASSPSGRAGSAIIFDQANNEVLLYGGYTTGLGVLTDTWTWDGTTWTEKFPATNPGTSSQRSRIAFHGGIGKVLLFNGALETWLWDGSEWAQESPATTPASSKALAYDEAHDQLIMHRNPFDETWTYAPVTVPASLNHAFGLGR